MEATDMLHELRTADRFSQGSHQGVPIRPGDLVEVARPQRAGSPLAGLVTVGLVVEVHEDDGDTWALLEAGWGRWTSNTADRSPARAEQLLVRLDGAEVRHGADPGAIWAAEWLFDAVEAAEDALAEAEAEADRLRGLVGALQDVNDARWRAERELS